MATDTATRLLLKAEEMIELAQKNHVERKGRAWNNPEQIRLSIDGTEVFYIGPDGNCRVDGESCDDPKKILAAIRRFVAVGKDPTKQNLMHMAPAGEA